MSSIPRRPSKVRRYETFQRFPQYLPDVKNQGAMNTWYDEVRRVLQRINEEIGDPLDDLKSLVDQTSSDLATVQSKVTALENEPEPVIEHCCDELRHQITLINNQITQIINIVNQPPVVTSGTGDDRLVFALMGG